MRVSDLTKEQTEHMAYRIDRWTATNYISIQTMIEQNQNTEVVDLFIKCGLGKRAAKRHAQHVVNFTLSKELKRIADMLGAVRQLAWKLDARELKMYNKIIKVSTIKKIKRGQ